MIERGRAVGN